MILIVTIPMRLPSVANLREHWRARAARTKAQRAMVRMHLLDRENRGAGKPALPVVVTLTRVAPRALDSHDNARAALKACVDGVADWLGVDDRDPRVAWRYEQARGKPKETALRVEVRSAVVSEEVA